ncbi:hypothetical protein DMENIID0001_050570 [Sergentomyia squamirostris]
MSDEESFVILGSTTPTPSLINMADSYATEFSSFPADATATSTQIKQQKLEGSKEEDELEGAVGGVQTLTENSVASIKSDPGSVKTDIREPVKPQEDSILTAPSFQLDGSVSTSNASLLNWPESEAAQPVSVSKFNIYQEFPSMRGQNINTQDLTKLETFCCEHNQLKENLLNSNKCLRQYFSLAEKWQNEIRDFKRQQDVYQSQVVTDNERLRSVVEQLEGKLKEKCAEVESIRVESRQGIEVLSEQHDREMQELRQQVEAIKMTAGSQTEADRKSVTDSEIKWRQELAHLEFSMGEKVRAAEIRKDEWQAEVAGLTEKYSRDLDEIRQRLAQETARVQQLEEQCKNWHDENDVLRINLASAEELNSQLQVQISQAAQKIVEIDAYRAQAEIYERDFEAERAQRTVLSGEKEQLLADLRLLQNRHEQLIGEMESIRRNPQQTGYPHHTESQRAQQQFRCPVCSRVFLDLSTLNRHINDCLDN